MALTSSRAPSSTDTISAFGSAAFLPWKSPPTSSVPPPALPVASSTAVPAMPIFWPSSVISPPCAPASVPLASMRPATVVMPSRPPSMTMRPPRCPMLRACTTPSMFSTVSAKPARAAARTSATPPSASTLPSSDSRVSRLPSLRTLKKIRPSPSTSTVTSVAAARPMRRASMVPRCVSCGATRMTLPPGAVICPSCTSSPGVPAPRPSTMRPAATSSLLMLSVLASSPPTSTRALAPKTMPRGLTSQTLPLDCRLPKICDGSLPSTRFSSTELLPGCVTTTRSFAPMEKLVQSMPARWVVCVMSSWFGAVCRTVVWPKLGTASCGSARPPCAAPSRHTAMLIGRSGTLWLRRAGRFGNMGRMVGLGLAAVRSGIS